MNNCCFLARRGCIVFEFNPTNLSTVVRWKWLLYRCFILLKKSPFNTWADIATRPSYIPSVGPEECRHTRVTAVYSFGEKTVRCGVSDCHEDHGQGFLVSISDHKETNVCEGCGQRLFSVAFGAQKKTLREKARVTEQRIRLNTILQQSDAIKCRVKDLKRGRHGANWLYQSLSNFRRTYPAELLAALSKLAVNQEDASILDALVENETGQSRLEQIQQLQGLGIFTTDIRETLIENILKPLDMAGGNCRGPGPKATSEQILSMGGWPGGAV